MKRILLVIFVLSISALAQDIGVRFGDSQPIRSTVTIPGIQGAIPVLVSNAVISFCEAPANAVPCTNKATTYTDSSLSLACSTSTQVTLAGSTSCVGTTDSSGAWGVWAAAGQYEWTVTANGASSGPYPATLGGSSSGGGGGTAGAVVIAPATSQILQATAPGVQTIFKMPTGAGATFPGYEIVTSAWIDDATTPNEVIVKFQQNKQTVFGTGAPGTGISTSAYNNVVECDSQTGADAGAKIAAAAALVSSGGVVDCRGLIGAQTIGSALTLTQSGVTYLFGKATFTIPTGVTVTNSGDDVQFSGIGEGTVFDASGSSNVSGQVITFTGNRSYLHDFKVMGNRIAVCGAGNICRLGGGGVHGQTAIKIGTSTVKSGSKIQRVSVYNAGFLALQMDNCNLCTFDDNYIEQSFSSALQVNSSQTVFNLVGGIGVTHNHLVDTNVGCGFGVSGDPCSTGQIAVISDGGVGVLGTVNVEGNIINNAVKTAWSGLPGDLGLGKTVCNTTYSVNNCEAGVHTCGGGGSADTACGMGIQSVYKAQHVSIVDNIITHTSQEAIITAGDGATSNNKMSDNACCAGTAGGISYVIDPGNVLAAAKNVTSINTAANLSTLVTSTALNVPLGSYIKIAGTADYNTNNGTNPIAWQLISMNDITKTYTFYNPISTGVDGAAGTVEDIGLGHGASITGNTCKDDGLCVSVQVGSNGVTNPDDAIIDGITVSGNQAYGEMAVMPTAFQVKNLCIGVCSSTRSLIKKLLFSGNTASGLVTNPFAQRAVSTFASGFANFRDSSPPWSTGRVAKLAQASALTNRSIFTDSTTTSSQNAAQTYQVCAYYKTQTVGTGTLNFVFTWTDENANAKTHTTANADVTSLTNEASRISECFLVPDGTGDILYSSGGTWAAGAQFDLVITTTPIYQ